MKKRHFYSFAFCDNRDNQIIVVSVYIGYRYKLVSRPQIEKAKEEAGISNNATMLSCCYLGKMTTGGAKTGSMLNWRARLLDKLKIFVDMTITTPKTSQLPKPTKCK